MDDVGPIIFGAFFLAFFALGFFYLRKKRAERIEALAAELDKPLTEEQTRARLPEPSEQPVPRADALAAAEKEALLALSHEDEARRAREKLEQSSADAAAIEKARAEEQ